MRLDDLRSPPLGLVLALGRPDAHHELAVVFRNLRPPLALTTRDQLTDAASALRARERKRAVRASQREVTPHALASTAHASGATVESSFESRAVGMPTTTASGGFRRSTALAGVLKRAWLSLIHI